MNPTYVQETNGVEYNPSLFSKTSGITKTIFVEI